MFSGQLLFAGFYLHLCGHARLNSLLIGIAEVDVLNLHTIDYYRPGDGRFDGCLDVVDQLNTVLYSSNGIELAEDILDLRRYLAADHPVADAIEVFELRVDFRYV